MTQLQGCFACAGVYLPVEVTQVAGSSGASHGQQLILQLPSGLGRGLVQIEIARGGFISQAVVSSTCHFALTTCLILLLVSVNQCEAVSSGCAVLLASGLNA